MAKDNPAYIYGAEDGDELLGKVGGLARLTPSVYFGNSAADCNGVTGWMNQPSLNHFRANVAEIRNGNDHPGGAPRYNGQVGPIPRAGPGHSIFDLDTRNLYFGQSNISPEESPMRVGGTYPIFPEGQTVAGLPVKLQQVHFRGFSPRGSSDEYSAYFLVSNPIEGFEATNDQYSIPEPDDLIDSDYALHKEGAKVTYWTANSWMQSAPGAEEIAINYDFEDRLIIGDPLRVTADIKYGYRNLYLDDYFDYLGYNSDHALDTEGKRENVYDIEFDETSLITRQDVAQPQNAKQWARGWDYTTPFEASVAARWTFYSGKYLVDGDAGWTSPPSDADVPSESELRSSDDPGIMWGDHWDIKYHTVPDANHISNYVDTTANSIVKSTPGQGTSVAQECWRMKIMRRFKPEIGKIYGCLDGNNWTLIDLVPGSSSGGDIDIDILKREYAVQIVQAGSDYSFEVNKVDTGYWVRGGWVNIFNKSVHVPDTNIVAPHAAGAAGLWSKIWLRVELPAVTAGANRRDGDLVATRTAGLDVVGDYFNGAPFPGAMFDQQGNRIQDPYVKWFLIADVSAAHANKNVPILQHVLGDIYDSNLPPVDVWPEDLTQGDIYDVLQLDKENGPPVWYTLRAQ